MNEVFTIWKNKNTPDCKAISGAVKPKQFIYTLSEDLLTAFTNLKLIDKYDVYQHLMTYWMDTMQDDCYLIVASGWAEGAKCREIFKVEDKNKKMVWAEQHDVEIGNRRFKSDLIPRQILIDKYFTAEQKNIETLEANADAIAAQTDELVEEHSGEGDKAFFSELDKVNKAEVSKELKAVIAELKTDKDNEELAEKKTVFEKYLKLLQQQAEANKKLKEAKAALEKLLLEKYAALTEAEIKTLVVDDKWMATLEHSVKNEMQRISQRLTQRIKELAERYETPMPTLVNDVNQWEEKINTHLSKMGFVWS